jgi:hypothetical protein
MATDYKGRLSKNLDPTRNLTPKEGISRDPKKYVYVYNRKLGYIEEIPLNEYNEYKNVKNKRKEGLTKKGKKKSKTSEKVHKTYKKTFNS